MPDDTSGMEERPRRNPFRGARGCCDDTTMDDLEVRVTDDPNRVLHEAGPFLRQDPVSHNSVLSVLCEAWGEVGNGHWWTVLAAGDIVGVAGQCPPTMPLLLTPMSRPAAAGASRIGYVFTPAELRGRGYASACVAALSAQVRDVLDVPCLLYTELANPSSNRIYRRLGYHAESEVLIYDFAVE